MKPGIDAPAAGLFGPTALFGLLDAIVEAAGADEAEASALVECERYSRFAHERLHQTLDRENVTVTLRLIHDGRLGKVQAQPDLPPQEIVRMARAAAVGPPLPSGFHFAGVEDGGVEVHAPVPPFFYPATAELTPLAKAGAIASAVTLAEERGARMYGSVHSTLYELALATSRGRRAYVPLSEAGWNLVSTWRSLSGLGFRLSRDVGRLDPEEIARESLDRSSPGALLGREPGQTVRLTEDRLPVVLCGYALAEAVSFLNHLGFDGRSAVDGASPLDSHAGDSLGSRRVQIYDDAPGADGLPIPFDQEGMPKRQVSLIAGGAPQCVLHDLRSAVESGATSTGHAHVSRLPFASPVAANLRLEPGDATEEALVAGIAHGVYVTSFHYVRLVDPQAGVITGMTRHGTYQIEDGRITRPMGNVRFTESVYEMLRNAEEIGQRLYAQPMLNVFNSCILAPSARLSSFKFDLVDA